MILIDFINFVSSSISVDVRIDKDPSGSLICCQPSQVLHFLNDFSLYANVLEIFGVSDGVISVLIESYDSKGEL